MQTAKTKVETAIREYARLFPDELKAFTTSVAEKVDKKDTKFAEVHGSDMLERHLFDMPETLYYAINRMLTKEEFDWLFNRTGDDPSGLKWFLSTYPSFSITGDY